MGVHARVDPVKKRAVPQGAPQCLPPSRLRASAFVFSTMICLADQGIYPVFDLFPYFGRYAEMRQILSIFAAFCLFDAFLLPF
jgi:hypothetical protein